MVITRGQIHVDWKIPDGLRIRTGRLELVPGSPSLSNVRWQEHEKLAALLGAEVPGLWPPELVIDPNSPDGVGWWDWYVISHELDCPLLIGVLGIKGWPAISGAVQEGGAFLPQFRRRGYATEAFDALTEWVFTHPEVDRITFDVPVESVEGVALVRKLGFSPASSYEQEGFLRFEKRRFCDGFSELLPTLRR